MGDQLLLGYLVQVEVMDVYWKSGSLKKCTSKFNLNALFCLSNFDMIEQSTIRQRSSLHQVLGLQQECGQHQERIG